MLIILGRSNFINRSQQTKDADFSNRSLYESNTKIIHPKIGNTRINALYNFLNTNWGKIEKVSHSHSLTNVYQVHIEVLDNIIEMYSYVKKE